jgi:signal transduction histidine kinase
MKEINDNIAHDLRSPLARIRGIAEMTLSDDKSIEDYKEMAVSTIEECDSLIGMINTMLDITEAEAGVNGSSTETFDVSALVLEACELFRPMADQRQIGMLTEVSPPLPFRGDRKKLQRIVTNIVENAIKYTPPKGKIRVSAAAADGKIQIVVNDDGIGISPEDLPHIFERFYRCDRSRSQSGVGLGLSLAKAYTQSMRGIITVESVLGRGSTFKLQFEA